VARLPSLARRVFDRFEPVHALTYFAPEARTALDGLGFRGFWMGYFAARCAPFGVVPTEVVTDPRSTTSPAAELAERAARSTPLDGRPLFAANMALGWPDQPVARLWHASRC
jgi:hypothetical protein